MSAPCKITIGTVILHLLLVIVSLGCAAPPANPGVSHASAKPVHTQAAAAAADDFRKISEHAFVQPASHAESEDGYAPRPGDDLEARETIAVGTPQSIDQLAVLEELATVNNPALARLRNEAEAEWARSGYVAKLPDPTVSSMFFTKSMNFMPDRQLAEFQVMQMIPWLGRLHAEAQRATLEALAAQNEYQAERLRVIGDLRANWYQLYVLGKQIEVTESDKQQLQSLITTASARVATGNAQPGDVLLATLELSSLQEQLIGYRQQVATITAELNRLAGRDPQLPITIPATIEAELPVWNHDLLREVAFTSQPELNAARLRTAATRWGIEVARLQRRPDLTFGAGWMVMSADPADPMPGAGDDVLTLNMTASVPLWHRKYDAMVSEASRRHYAAHASEEEIAQRLESALRSLWQQAEAYQETVELYATTILPQARQTFEADQQALVNNAVSFDRVVRDYRTVLNLELGYHRARGQLATAIARIRQTVGVDLLAAPAPEPP